MMRSASVSSVKRFLRWLQGERRGLTAGFEMPSRREQEKSLLAPTITIENTVLLADVSFWQETINFVKMKAEGIEGVIIRAGQRNWEDIRFRENWPKAKEAGLPRGSYWFYDSRDTPERQAALWWSLIRGDVGDLVLVADFEENYGGAYGTKAHFKKFVQEIQRLSGLPNERIVIYTGFYWWGSRVGNDPFFKAYPLWLAWYNVMSVVRVPLPWSEADLILWQFTSSGDGRKYGVSSAEIDLNWYCCSRAHYIQRFGLSGGAPPPTNADTVTHPFAGVKQVHGERFGCKVYVNVIEPDKVRLEVRNEDGWPSQNCSKYGAQIAWNGDDWDRTTRIVKDNPSPSLLVFPDRLVSIGDWRMTLGEQYHSSGLRYLVQGGQNVIPVNGTEPKYTERHARSISGMTQDGKFVHLTVDGDWPDKGMLLYECGQVMREFGAVTAFDQGGGGDSVEVLKGNVVNVPDDDVNGVHYERKVPQTILVYAQETNMAYGTAREALGNIAKVRDIPSRYGREIYQVPAGGTVEFVQRDVPAQILGTADKAGETWLKLADGYYVNQKLFSGGVLKDYFVILSDPSTEPPPPPPPIGKAYTVIVDLEGYKPVTHTGVLEPE